MQRVLLHSTVFSIVLTILVLVSIRPAFTQDADASAPSSPGAKLFATNCVLCHGADGKGSPTGKTFGVADLTSATVQKMTDAELVEVISNGKLRMPAWKGTFTSPQILQLVKYVRTFKGK